MRVERTGYGMGTKKFDRANCIRAFWGNSRSLEEEIVQLSCNLDDMTGEDLGFAQALLLEAGALDVYTTAIGMKKSRPAVMLTCLCRPEEATHFADLMLRHTTTLGVREHPVRKHPLRRTFVEVPGENG